MTEILVEVRPQYSGQKAGQLSSVPAPPEALTKRIDEVADALRDLSAKIEARLGEFDPKGKSGGFLVDEIELKVNIDLEAEAGVVIARAKTGAGFEASIKWKRAGK